MESPLQPPSLYPTPWRPGRPLPWSAHRPGDGVPQEPWLLQVDRRDPLTLSAIAELEALLSTEERNQIDRLRRPEDRQRALLGRGVLRWVLGDWLVLDPAALRFAAGSHGKPELVGPCPTSWQSKPSQSQSAEWPASQSIRRRSEQFYPKQCHSRPSQPEQVDSEKFHSLPFNSELTQSELSQSELSQSEEYQSEECQEQSPRFRSPFSNSPSSNSPKLNQPQFNQPQFNLSHSGELILLAFHARDPVGVDVERQRSDWDWRPIARRCLDPSTVESLLALAPAEAASAFVQAWCDLEAGLKARGVGLVGANDGQAQAMEPRLRRWRLAVPAGYAGAVALLDPGSRRQAPEVALRPS
ncbi:MAG: 4'-phosphopantetheinyl transferase family protein [Cyanobacteriota bacterium]